MPRVSEDSVLYIFVLKTATNPLQMPLGIKTSVRISTPGKKNPSLPQFISSAANSRKGQ